MELQEKQIRDTWDMFRNENADMENLKLRARAIFHAGEPLPLWIVVRAVFSALSLIMQTASPDSEAVNIQYQDDTSGLWFTITWSQEQPELP